MKIVACLNINVHESTNPFIEGYPMWVFNLFSSLIRFVTMKSLFLNYVSTGKCDFWKFTSCSFFVTQYSCMMLFIIWYCWSILMPCSLYMMLILRSFGFFPSCNVYTNIVPNSFIGLSNKIRFYIAMRI